MEKRREIPEVVSDESKKSKKKNLLEKKRDLKWPKNYYTHRRENPTRSRRSTFTFASPLLFSQPDHSGKSDLRFDELTRAHQEKNPRPTGGNEKLSRKSCIIEFRLICRFSAFCNFLCFRCFCVHSFRDHLNESAPAGSKRESQSSS